MKVYNDEKLCPEIFEQMAKEYSKQKQQLVVRKIENNIDEKNSLIRKVENNINKISSSIDYLSSFNLSQTNKAHLEKLKQYQDKIKEHVTEENIKMQNSNFCQSLQQTTSFCTSTIKKIIALQNHCNEDEYTKYLNIQDSMLDIINILVHMFGVCKYRK